MRKVMLGLAAVVWLSGVGLTEAFAGGCPGGRCGAWSYSTPVYSGCGPGGCSTPVYSGCGPGGCSVYRQPYGAPAVAARAPRPQTYAYRPSTTYYRGGVNYPNGAVRTVARPQAPVRVAPPPAQPPADLPK